MASSAMRVSLLLMAAGAVLVDRFGAESPQPAVGEVIAVSHRMAQRKTHGMAVALSFLQQL